MPTVAGVEAPSCSASSTVPGVRPSLALLRPAAQLAGSMLRLAFSSVMVLPGGGESAWQTWSRPKPIEHAADVAQNGAPWCRRWRSATPPRGRIFLLDVVDHAVAAVLAEVDVEVGHRHALRVEEALEQQVVGAAGRGR